MATSLRSLSRSFSAGEVTPELYGHIDLAKYQTGLAVARNFITLPHGPAVNRPGFAFVRETKNSNVVSRLIPFSYNNTQTFAIELGAGYFRWHTSGAVLMAGAPAAYDNAHAYAIGDLCASGGVNYYCIAVTTGHAPPNGAYWYAQPASGEYEIPNGYAAADLMDIHYVQSADVLTLVHPNYPVQELRRYGATNWQLAAPAFQAPTNVPTSVNAYVYSPAPPSGITPYPTSAYYVVTAINETNLEETIASGVANVTPTAINVSIGSMTNANPGVFTTAIPGFFMAPIPHGFAAGDTVTLAGMTGTAGVNGTRTIASVPSPSTFTVGTAGVPLDTTAAGAYTTGGTASRAATPAPGAAVNDLTLAGHYNTISWTAPATGTVIRYNVYKNDNGLFGFIGQTTDTTFKDNNIVADVSMTPPVNGTGFNDAAGNYPSAVTYYEQRRVFGGTTNKPQNIWMTRSSTETNMSYSIPTTADNRLAFRIASREASKVQHLVPVANLIALTPSCEWKATSGDGNALAPSNITVKPQSYVGANNVTPVVTGNSVLFAASRGGHMREMSYSWQANGYMTGDVSLLAPHLFDYYTITDLAYQKSPYPIMWAVSSSGQLLGMTYVPEQQVAGWHKHDTTNGIFEAICCIAESNQDYLYAIVKRTFGGVTKRFVERMASRYFPTVADTFFVDCGATYSGAPTTTIGGLTWLEGQTVNILADGAALPQQVVSNTGTITLPVAASKVAVGLPITADIQTLPLSLQIDGAFGQGRLMNVNAVFLRLFRSSGVWAGPSFDKLVQYKQRTTEPYGTPPNPVSTQIKIPVSPSWENDGQVCIRQSDPLPVTISSMTIEVAAGG